MALSDTRSIAAQGSSSERSPLPGLGSSLPWWTHGTPWTSYHVLGVTRAPRPNRRTTVLIKPCVPMGQRLHALILRMPASRRHWRSGSTSSGASLVIAHYLSVSLAILTVCAIHHLYALASTILSLSRLVFHYRYALAYLCLALALCAPHLALASRPRS